MLTSGISAEYGRFTGGVINAITKSGGNSFSGSGRINFLNPTWTTETPFEECVNKACRHLHRAVQPSRQAVEDLRGHVRRSDRARPAVVLHVRPLRSSPRARRRCSRRASCVPTTDSNKRGEIKITGTVVNNHTIQGGYLNNPRKRTNNSGLQSFIIDPHSEVDRENPNWYSFTNYRGVLGSNLLAEAQYSERRFQFKGDGGTSTDIADSPFLAVSCACLYNAPVLRRDRPGAAQQQADHRQHHELLEQGRPARDQDRLRVLPQPADGRQLAVVDVVRVQRRLPDRRRRHAGARRHRPSDSGLRARRVVRRLLPGDARRDDEHRQPLRSSSRTTGRINDRWSADLGARYEQVKAVSNRRHHQRRRRPHRAASRLGLRRQGNGNHIMHFTYGQYSGRYNEAQIGANSPVGNPADIIQPNYTGPGGSGLWLRAGLESRQLPDHSTTRRSRDPLQNVFIEDGVRSRRWCTSSRTVVRGESLQRPRLRGGQLHLPQDHQHDRGLPGHDDRHDQRPWWRASAPARSRTSCIETPTWPTASTRPGVPVPLPDQEQLDRQRPLHGAAPERRQLRRRRDRTRRATTSPSATIPEIFTAAAVLPGRPSPELPAQPLPPVDHLQRGMGAAGDLSFSGLWRVEGARRLQPRGAEPGV